MNRDLRIVILYSSLAPFFAATIRELSKLPDVESIDLVYWDKRGISSTRYEVESFVNVDVHLRSALNEREITSLLLDRRPHLIYVSGWMDKAYLHAIRKIKRRGVKSVVVCGIDDQWEGRVRQRLGQIYFRFFFRRLFDFLWVSGKPQYHFAQRFGYPAERIICQLLSADTRAFDQRAEFSRRFVFVGRFAPVKGLDLLLEAYTSLPATVRAEWPLVLIGEGELRGQIEQSNVDTLIVKPFLQPRELRAELLRGGVACMPSYHEQWGVAIHEMALMGYPLILSSACGSASEFLIPGYNGYMFRSGDVTSLRASMLRMAEVEESARSEFASRSIRLGGRITTEQSVHSFLSAVELARI